MATLQPDPWKALGVDRSADKSEIRTAYKKLVLKCHPDKVQDLTLKAQKQKEFQKVQEAYELLNDDDKLEKYEDQIKLMELRKQAAMMAKNMPNSSASRSPRHMSYEIRTAEPRHKPSSTPSAGAKVYAHYASVHSRSHEEMPSRIYPFDDGEKHARRTTSYDKVFREEDRRDKDERRRSKRDDDDFRIRERRDRDRELKEKEREVREKEQEREARRADRKRSDRERDSQRRRDVEDKHRRHKSPYIEQYESDEQPPFSKTEKRSSSKKPYEGREREREPRDKSTASRRPPSPQIENVQPAASPLPAVQDTKLHNNLDKAADYIERSRRQYAAPAGVRAVQDSFDVPVSVPTPPPAHEAEPPRAIPRVAGRRSSHSHEASRSKEKLSSSHKSASAFVVDASPKGRGIPMLQKAYTSPPLAPEPSSPPRISRSSTTPHEYAAGAPVPPSFSRTQTWAPGGGGVHDRRHDGYDHDDSDDDRHHRHRHRSSRRTRSPEPSTRTYKVDSSLKTTPYSYGDSPSARKYMPETYESHSGNSYPSYIKVKESKSYGPADVKYSEVPYPYATRNESYSQVY